MATSKTSSRTFSISAYSGAKDTVKMELSYLKDEVDDVLNLLSDYNARAVAKLKGKALRLIKKRLIMHENAFKYLSIIIEDCIQQTSDCNDKMIKLIQSLLTGDAEAISDENLEELNATYKDFSDKLNAAMRLKNTTTDETTIELCEQNIKKYADLANQVYKAIEIYKEALDKVARSDSEYAKQVETTIITVANLQDKVIDKI